MRLEIRATRWSAVERRMTESTGLTSDAGAKEGSEGRRHRVRYDNRRLTRACRVVCPHKSCIPKSAPGRVRRSRHFLCDIRLPNWPALTQDIQAGHLSILRFYAKRARRIFPALALVLICIWGAGGLFTASEFAAWAGIWWLQSSSQTISCFGRKAGTSTTTALDKPLLHLWSLGIEEQFYLVVPAMLWLGTRGTAGSIRWVARLGGLSLLSTIILSGFDYAGSFYLFTHAFLGAGCRSYTGPSRVAKCKHVRSSRREFNFFRSAMPVKSCCFPSRSCFCSVLAWGAKDPQGEWNTVVSDGGLALTIILAIGAAWLTDRYAQGDAWHTLTSRCARHGEVCRDRKSIAGFVLIGISIAALTSASWPGPQTALPCLARHS